MAIIIPVFKNTFVSQMAKVIHDEQSSTAAVNHEVFMRKTMSYRSMSI